MHTNSRLLFQKYAIPHMPPTARVLEIGPNGFPSTYQSLVRPGPAAWDTLDIFDAPQLTYPKSEPYRFPIADNSYDVIVAGNVLEHVPKMWVWIREVARVCKPGGIVITINPVSWPYHEAPVDCWRAYPEGMKALYAEADLDVLHSSTEALEDPGYKRRVPGMSYDRFLVMWSLPIRTLYRALRLARFPCPTAYDTVTIGRKRTAGGATG